MAGNVVRVLNEGTSSANKPDPAPDIAAKLQKSMLKLKGKFIASDGKKVDYAALKKSKEFEEYLSEIKELQKVKLDALTEIQRKVFFIISPSDNKPETKKHEERLRRDRDMN